MNKLYMIGIGGKTEKSNIEVHDVQLLVNTSIEACHEQLRNNWYGIAKSLHMDSYLHVKGVKGYEIEVRDSINDTDQALYLVTFGGYQADVFQEIHCYELVVASSEKDARSKAMAQVKHELKNIHVDNIVEVNRALTGSDCDLHFIESEKEYSSLAEWQGYTKLNK